MGKGEIASAIMQGNVWRNGHIMLSARVIITCRN